ncbi:dihydrolipoamide acetyltransferase component of pyruvate dehydrogenase complex [Thalassobaculum fulvum]|uniref:Dihydrolipoamide acetyltransferase component of pyruvate dehydrogenase complex n=1 Tax=Thalassobaculum fulvum TaxID=1633335 RepID=A0A919CS92_9PROT|nr:dihydrolipoamide acetyltransferase family protein [Thalassobaculum fulvum]GHD62392.1 dihydrolipoamide acetyltransferase component of pyruvate dehydrogenase complex [Thalassobaculum fulvum]
MADLVMPKLGLTMTEGLLAEWRVKPGDAYAAGDILFVVETEKIANEIEATEPGAIEAILVAEGETVPVGTPVARTADGSVSPAPVPERPTPAQPAPAQAGGGDRIVATPLARRLAAERGVDLAAVDGSGPRGRIKACDVERCAAAPARRSAPSPAGNARAATARRVAASKRDVPHFYVQTEAEVTALAALRAELNADARYPRITVSHLLIKAVGNALAAMPEINRIWLDEQEFALDTVDVGLVAETPDGLRIPVIRDVAARPLDVVAAEARDKVGRARDGNLVPEDVGGGAISISNVGMHDVTALVPIISPPQSMILGVGAERGVFRPDTGGNPVARREIALSLACDHRVIDGALAARFLASVAEAIRSPLGLLRPAP